MVLIVLEPLVAADEVPELVFVPVKLFVKLLGALAALEGGGLGVRLHYVLLQYLDCFECSLTGEAIEALTQQLLVRLYPVLRQLCSSGFPVRAEVAGKQSLVFPSFLCL